MTRALLHVAALSAIALGLIACKQELPKDVQEPNVFGTVQELKTVASEQTLIYQLGQDPYKAHWGSATGRYVKVDDVFYPLHWDEAQKFKDLKVGDKVNLHTSEFIACTGENDLKPNCHRMMRVFRSERRINPLMHR